MPRAVRGRFEPLDHFVLGHVSILGFSALGSPHTVKRFIDLAIVVRAKLTHHTSLVRRSYETDIACGFGLAVGRCAAVARVGLAGRRSCAACWLARRPCPPSSVDIIELLTLSAAVPTNAPAH